MESQPNTTTFKNNLSKGLIKIKKNIYFVVLAFALTAANAQADLGDLKARTSVDYAVYSALSKCKINQQKLSVQFRDECYEFLNDAMAKVNENHERDWALALKEKLIDESKKMDSVTYSPAGNVFLKAGG